MRRPRLRRRKPGDQTIPHDNEPEAATNPTDDVSLESADVAEVEAADGAEIAPADREQDLPASDKDSWVPSSMIQARGEIAAPPPSLPPDEDRRRTETSEWTIPAMTPGPEPADPHLPGVAPKKSHADKPFEADADAEALDPAVDPTPPDEAVRAAVSEPDQAIANRVAELEAGLEAARERAEAESAAAAGLRQALEAATERTSNLEQSRVEELARARREAEIEIQDLKEKLTALEAHMAESAGQADARLGEAQERADESRRRTLDLEEQMARAMGEHAAAKRQLEERLEHSARRERAAEIVHAERMQALSELHEAEARRAAQYKDHEQRMAELEERIHRADRVVYESAQRVAAATAGGVYDDAGRVELNSVSFEGLRRLGLSTTQAARVVSSRELKGGFESVDDLTAVPGLPNELVDTVRNSVYVEESP